MKIRKRNKFRFLKNDFSRSKKLLPKTKVAATANEITANEKAVGGISYSVGWGGNSVR